VTTQECVPRNGCSDCERNEELIGVLTAISVVSKRLAVRLTALDRKMTVKPRGGKGYVTRPSTAIRK
jgi:hypothetical protein